MLKNKKGLSEIVSILVIVLLVIVSTGIIWGVVSNILEKSSNKIASQTECMDLKFKLKFLNKVREGNYEISIQRESTGTDEAIGAKINFYGPNGMVETSTESAREFTLNGERFNKLDTYLNTFWVDLPSLSEILITPYLVDEKTNEERICPEGQSFKVNLKVENVEACNNQCILGSKQCSTLTNYQTCIRNAQGCLVWSTSSCSYGQRCSSGNCFSPSIFVSSTIFYSGNLVGLSGADRICQELAQYDGSFTGTWKAWISGSINGDSPHSATQRLVHLSAPYILPNGVIVADNWSDLTDGILKNPINVTEQGVVVDPIRVNTGTHPNGSSFYDLNPYNPYDPWNTENAGRYCQDWTFDGSLDYGWSYAGYTNETNWRWTTQSPVSCTVNTCGGGGCSDATPFRIYCLRQDVEPV